jgi:hypothetical protein
MGAECEEGSVSADSMARVKRVLCAAPILAAALLPLAAAAAPSPSPGLDHLLLAPPSGYAAVSTSTVFDGRFTAHDLSATWGAKAAEIEKILGQDGFVDGFGGFWVNEAAHRAVIEYVIAFSGESGARSWLSYGAALDKTDPAYQHADVLPGIDTYSGEHLVYPSNDVFDGFIFVKGNDLFAVGFESRQDDVLGLTITQARNQYDSAPDSTIPPAQWPENAGAGSSRGGAGSDQGAPFEFGGLIGLALVFAAIAVLIVMGVTLVKRWAASRPAAILLTSDGRYWWDGQFWRDSQLEVPQTAKRSADGLTWWDGNQWRPVPQPALFSGR